MFYDLPAVTWSPMISSLRPPCPNDTGRDVRLAPEAYDGWIASSVLTAGGLALYVYFYRFEAALTCMLSSEFQCIITLVSGDCVVWSKIRKVSVEPVSREKGDEEEREALLDL